MTVKEYLNQLSLLKQEANQKKEELKYAKQEPWLSHKANGSIRKVQTPSGGFSSQTEQQVIRAVTLENAVNESILTYLEEKHKIVNRIHELDDGNHIDILYKRYVEDIRHFEDIAYDMGCSYQYIINKHSEALKAFENKFSDLFQTCYKM